MTRWKCQNEIADGALDEVRIYFPDPWHKKRHNKRRLLQPAFAELLVRKLRRVAACTAPPTGKTTPSRCGTCLTRLPAWSTAPARGQRAASGLAPADPLRDPRPEPPRRLGPAVRPHLTIA